MVLKPALLDYLVHTVFYSSVILNGTETVSGCYDMLHRFYSSVILNGTETGQR